MSRETVLCSGRDDGQHREGMAIQTDRSWNGPINSRLLKARPERG